MENKKETKNKDDDVLIIENDVIIEDYDEKQSKRCFFGNSQCDKCKTKTKKKNLLLFENKKICVDCYNRLSKSEKKKLVYLGGRITLKPEGFLFGVAGGFGYSSGVESGTKWAMKGIMKRHNITEKQLNDKSIDTYNQHFYMCRDKEQNVVIESLGVKRNRFGGFW